MWYYFSPFKLMRRDALDQFVKEKLWLDLVVVLGTSRLIKVVKRHEERVIIPSSMN